MDGITQLGINLPALITQVISFVILLLVLTKLLYKPLLKILDERSEKIKNSLEMADEARKEAEKARAEMQEEIKAARIEGQETVAKAKTIAENLGIENRVDQTLSPDQKEHFGNSRELESYGFHRAIPI